MKTWSIVLVLTAAFAIGSGCAKSDWIQHTLVTVDVTGTWLGAGNRPGGAPSFETRFELEQEGPKVKGTFLLVGSALPTTLAPSGSPWGPIEGTVAGDVFRFIQPNGMFSGEMTVNGDEMTGYVRGFPLSLRRISSTPRPISQP